MWRGVGDDDVGNIAWPRSSRPIWHGDMDQPVVSGATRHTRRRAVLPTFAVGKHDLDGSAHLTEVLLKGDLVDQTHQPLIAFLDDRLGHLPRHSCRGCAWTD